MCYAKPGPRCSSHAAARLTIAKRNFKHHRVNPTITDYEEARRILDTAQNEYDATPAGIKELQRRIRDHQSTQAAAYRLRLERGVVLRKAQLAAIQAEDKGDIKHETAAVKRNNYLSSFFPDDTSDRSRVGHFESSTEAMIEESEEWTSKLDADEMEALAWFTSNGAGSVNAYIVSGKIGSGPFRYSKKTLEKTRAKLDSALKKFSRDEPVLVYRGLSQESLGEDFSRKKGMTYDEARGDVVKTKFAEGTIYSSSAFTSSSIDPVKAAGFANSGITLEILTKKAAPLVNVSAWDVSEKEMIIPRNQKYKVHKVIKNPSYDGKVREKDYLVQLIEI